MMEFSSGPMFMCQMRAMLLKNVLLKTRYIIGTLLELTLPIAFMSVLVVLKNEMPPVIIDEDDAAYVCGGDVSCHGKHHCNYNFEYDAQLSDATWPSDQSLKKNRWFSYNTIEVAPCSSDDQHRICDNFKKYVERKYPEIAKERNERDPKEAMVVLKDDEQTLIEDRRDFIDSMAIIFKEVDVDESRWEYSIRLPRLDWGGIPSTRSKTTVIGPGLTDQYMDSYAKTRFLTIQLLVDEFAQSEWPSLSVGDDIVPENKVLPKIKLGMLPVPAHHAEDGSRFFTELKMVLGLLFLLSYLYPLSRLIKSIMHEKETKIKEGMMMMGLKESVFYMSWFVTAGVQYTLTAIVMTVIIADVFEHSDKGLLFMLFFLFGLNVIAFCFLVCTFFDRAKRAAIGGVMIFFGVFFPYMAVDSPSYEPGTKAALSLLAPSCFGFAISNFAAYESEGLGVTADTANSNELGLSYNTTISMLLLDFALYTFLAWYLDKVIPHEFGTHQHPLFIFSKSYWFGTPLSGLKSPLLADLEGDASQDSRLEGKVEAIPGELKAQEHDNKCITISGLRKEFNANGSLKVAVDDLDLSLYEGQISVLLGHNGAGKSTAINMLTGLIAPTSGDAVVQGHSISTNMAEVRHSLGVCPQHDILFPQLTVREHLRLFAVFKGVPSGKVNEAVEDMIKQVGLVEKRNVASKALSGGMKRKLSVGIALIGDSKVVILDEPTSGMDPYSRRSTWDMLQKARKGRVILLTTHFMDEADILGDRIAIMGEGQLRCAGSPLFLKKLHGVGYTLTLVMEQEQNPESPVHPGAKQAASELVHKHVPEGEVLYDVGAELSFRLPLAAAPAFRHMFAELDANVSPAGGIATYAIAVTSMEEVFIRVARGLDGPDESAKTRELVRRMPSAPTGNNQDVKKEEDGAMEGGGGAGGEGGIGVMEPVKMFYLHVYALLVKRLIYAKRDKKMMYYQLILPILILAVGLSLLLIRPPAGEEPEPSLLITAESLGHNAGFAQGLRDPIPFYAATEEGGKLAAKLDGQAVLLTKPATGAYRYTSDTQLATTHMYNDREVECSWGPDDLVYMSNFMLNKEDEEIREQLEAEQGASRYGAIAELAPGNSGDYDYAVLVNSSAVHAAPLYLNQLNQARLRVRTGRPDAYIRVHNHPLPRSRKVIERERKDEEDDIEEALPFVASLMAAIAFSFIPTSFVIFVVRERECKAKHQQVISGVSLWAYWVSTFLWDSISYLLTGGLAIGLFHIYGLDAFTEDEAAGPAAKLVLLFGPAAAAFTYCISFAFKSHSEAQNWVLFLSFVSGLVLSIASFALSLTVDTFGINTRLKGVLFRLFPLFNLSEGLWRLASCKHYTASEVEDVNRNYAETYDPDLIFQPGYLCRTGVGVISEPWVGLVVDMKLIPPSDPLVSGDAIDYLLITCVVYFFIAVGIEFAWSTPVIAGWLQRITTRDRREGRARGEAQDSDVAEEAARVKGGGGGAEGGGDVIVLNGLRKVYGGVRKPSKVAVKDLSFGVHKGECFGFLGINGAGKTTSLSILSGEIPATSGSAAVAGFDVSSEQLKLRRKIGYCPQFDALLDLLTVQEHLELYARIKGVRGSDMAAVVDDKIEHMDLTAFRHKTAGSLSGGNKRKLSVAVAMIGSPSIVFLDEPSTGMDPVARRFMWEVIEDMCKGGPGREACSVMLTTHSMEEAEALCQRIGIMVDGGLRCLGSAPHLKNKFGEGYELDLKTRVPEKPQLAPLLVKLRGLVDDGGEEARESDGDGLEGSEFVGGVVGLGGAVSAANLDAACTALGDTGRRAMIKETGPGMALFQMLEQDKQVPVRSLLEFWVSEDRAQALYAFMDRSYANASCVEHATSTSFRYKVPRHGHASGELTLSTLFGEMEDAKEELCIAEYSVGQTTLEQIFNHFAATDLNPEVGRSRPPLRDVKNPLNVYNAIKKGESLSSGKHRSRSSS